MVPGYKRPSEKSTAEAEGEPGALSRQPAFLRGLLPKAFQVHTLSLPVMTTPCRLCSLTSPTPSQHEGEHLATLLSAQKKCHVSPGCLHRAILPGVLRVYPSSPFAMKGHLLEQGTVGTPPAEGLPPSV